MKRGAAFLITLFLGCTGSNNTPGKEFPTSGTFYQNSTLSIEDRIQIQKGNDVTVYKELTEEEAFYLQFLKPEEIYDGIIFDIKDTSILVYIVQQASPAGYTIIPQEKLEGKIEVESFGESHIKMKLVEMVFTIGTTTHTSTFWTNFSQGTLP
jgi:hypothetical protein